MRACRHPPKEPLFGELSLEHIQFVPQSIGVLTEELAEQFRVALPGSRMRLHANTRVLPNREISDLAAWETRQPYFRQLAKVSRLLDSPAYTAHAGRRDQASLSKVFDAARRAADLFGVPVGVEGHYPTRDDRWLLSTWEEYAQLLEARAPYALDLSHLHILATQTGRVETGLTRDLLESECAIEIHVSGCDGEADTHDVPVEAPWWFDLLKHCGPQAVVFSEANHFRFH